MSESKKPKIRFQGFSGEWDINQLYKKIIKIIDFRGRTPKKLGMDWSNEGYLALSALNVKNGFIDKTIVANCGDEVLYNKWMSGSELHKGQVLMTTEAPVGNVAQIPDNEKYILSQRTIAFVVSDEIFNEVFLAILLRSEKVNLKLLALSSGGTAKGVSQKSLQELDISYPKEVDEQVLIGDYFKHIDNLILQKQKKYEKLVKMKSVMLEKMFPVNTIDVPDIRFSSYIEKWNKINLGEMITYTKGYAFQSKEFSDNGIRVIRVTDLSKDSILDEVEKIYINNESVAIYKSYEIEIGDIIVTTVGSRADLRESAVGRPIIVRILDISLLNQNLVKMTSKSGFEAEFIYAQISREEYKIYILNIERGNANQANITIGDLFKFNMLYTSIEEQQKIGNYFKTLDKLISLQEKEIEKLKNIKKSLLEKMFV